jgi:hypothetical protein
LVDTIVSIFLLRPGLCEFSLQCAADGGLVLVGTCGLAKATGKCEPIYLFARPGNVQQVRQLFLPASGRDVVAVCAPPSQQGETAVSHRYAGPQYLLAS